MSDHDPVIGKAPLIAAAVLIVACLGAVGMARAGWAPRFDPPSAEAEAPAVERLITFEDLADGSVVVRSLDGGRDVVIAPDSGGFLRGVARTLTRDRKMRGLGREAPFRMAEARDGTLTLTDTATGRTLKLDAFGPDNRQAFRNLLHEGAA
jgi:putative photosynthetic complex assembly protein